MRAAMLEAIARVVAHAHPSQTIGSLRVEDAEVPYLTHDLREAAAVALAAPVPAAPAREAETVDPTHRCKVCGALWRRNPDASWSLWSKSAGPCCDNAPMAKQIEPLTSFKRNCDSGPWGEPVSTAEVSSLRLQLTETEEVLRSIEGWHRVGHDPAFGDVVALVDRARRRMSLAAAPAPTAASPLPARESPEGWGRCAVCERQRFESDLMLACRDGQSCCDALDALEDARAPSPLPDATKETR